MTVVSLLYQCDQLFCEISTSYRACDCEMIVRAAQLFLNVRKRLVLQTFLSLVFGVSLFILLSSLIVPARRSTGSGFRSPRVTPRQPLNLSHTRAAGTGPYTRAARPRAPVIQPWEPCRVGTEARDVQDGRWYNMSRSDYLLYTYSSFLDTRLSLLSLNPVIRIIAVTSAFNSTPEQFSTSDGQFFSCLLYFEQDREPLVVPAQQSFFKIGMGWPLNGVEMLEFIITCPLTYPDSTFKWPKSVSLVRVNSSRPDTCMPVEIPESVTERREFVVCVPVTFGHINPWVLVQWMEMQRILGIDRIFIYDYNISTDTMKVIQHYISEGLIELRRTEAYGYIEPDHYWLHNSPVINDCMYRNMRRYRYVVVIDVDELLLPVSHTNLSLLVKHLEQQEISKSPHRLLPSSYLFRNAYYFLDHPHDNSSTLTYMRYRKVSYSPLGYASKSISSMESCIAMHNHFCWMNTPAHQGPTHVEVNVEPELAVNAHYKKCHFSSDECRILHENANINDYLTLYAHTLQARAAPAYTQIFHKSPTL